MPALGLLLEYPIFESYNRKIAADNEKMSPTDPNQRQPIDFEAHREDMEKFKQEWIYTRVRATEQRVPMYVFAILLLICMGTYDWSIRT